MTPKERAVMQQALDALEKTGIEGTWLLHDEAITALREALAEQEKPLYRKVLREMLDAQEQAEQEPDILSKSLKRIQSLERQLKIVQQQWDNSREYALELAERLFKYEDGSPMLLNSEQAEREPVAIEELAWEKYCECTAGDMDVRDFWEELQKSVQQQYIAKVSCSYPNCNCPFDHPGGDWCAKGLSTNAAPVRTKDLTDDEIEWLVVDTLETWNSKDTMKDFARAVIAADREKNK